MQTIVPHHMQHNTEPEAVDLLLEVDDVEQLLDHIDESNYQRTCLYLTSTAAYLSEPDDTAVYNTAFKGYMKVKKFHDAMRVALRLNNRSLMEEVFIACEDQVDKQQLAYLLARQGVMLDVEDGPCAIDDEDTRTRVCFGISLVICVLATSSTSLLAAVPCLQKFHFSHEFSHESISCV
jgi:26S proteasome regulatory subunit N1